MAVRQNSKIVCINDASLLKVVLPIFKDLKMGIAIEFELPAKIRKKGAWFISSCPLLDVFSQGRTRIEAERNLVDALASFLTSCYQRGTLDAALRESEFLRG